MPLSVCLWEGFSEVCSATRDRGGLKAVRQSFFYDIDFWGFIAKKRNQLVIKAFPKFWYSLVHHLVSNEPKMPHKIPVRTPAPIIQMNLMMPSNPSSVNDKLWFWIIAWNIWNNTEMGFRYLAMRVQHDTVSRHARQGQNGKCVTFVC